MHHVLDHGEGLIGLIKVMPKSTGAPLKLSSSHGLGSSGEEIPENRSLQTREQDGWATRRLQGLLRSRALVGWVSGLRLSIFSSSTHPDVTTWPTLLRVSPLVIINFLGCPHPPAAKLGTADTRRTGRRCFLPLRGQFAFFSLLLTTSPKFNRST